MADQEAVAVGQLVEGIGRVILPHVLDDDLSQTSQGEMRQRGGATGDLFLVILCWGGITKAS